MGGAGSADREDFLEYTYITYNCKYLLDFENIDFMWVRFPECVIYMLRAMVGWCPMQCEPLPYAQ